MNKGKTVIFKDITGIYMLTDSSIRSVVNKEALSRPSSLTKLALVLPEERVNIFRTSLSQVFRGNHVAVNIKPWKMFYIFSWMFMRTEWLGGDQKATLWSNRQIDRKIRKRKSCWLYSQLRADGSNAARRGSLEDSVIKHFLLRPCRYFWPYFLRVSTL